MTDYPKLLTEESVAELISNQRSPCLSIYQATHRRHPENQQDPIRFRNLMRELEASLLQTYSADETRRSLDPFDSLARDEAFWRHTLDGLAVLGGPNLFRVFRLQRPVPEMAIVADSFHTKPLRRQLQSLDRFQVLGLSLSQVQLFEGNRDAFDEIELAPGVPRTITEALGDELTEPHSTVASYGGLGQGTVSMHHGHGGRKDLAEFDAERFFRVLDRAVIEHNSHQSGLPLLLAALPEHHHLFRQVSHNPFLIAEGLNINPAVLPITELRRLAWEVVEPQYAARLAALVDDFALAESRGLGSADPANVAQAAVGGRVATLLIESGRKIARKLDSLTGTIEAADLTDPHVDDLLDDLGELVERLGGRVMVLPTDLMPGRTGLAATYRY